MASFDEAIEGKIEYVQDKTFGMIEQKFFVQIVAVI
jgi:hypothetical protein